MKKNKKSYYNYLVGKAILIVNIGDKDEFSDRYIGRVGVVESVDSIGHLHGTWGGMVIIPEEDDFIVTHIHTSIS